MLPECAHPTILSGRIFGALKTREASDEACSRTTQSYSASEERIPTYQV